MTDPPGDPPPAATRLFGPRLAVAARYAALLARSGVERGLVGPGEAERVWDRHLLNSAVVAELIPLECRMVDVGSGAGLPGIPLAIARPDLVVTLLEPMARRVAWLLDVVDELEIPVAVVRGRAEERAVREQVGGADAVTARAVAPLARLSGWALPLLRTGGQLVAVKGATAAEEARRDAEQVRAAGGGRPMVVRCGVGVVDPPATVVLVERTAVPDRRPHRKDR